MTLKQKFLYFIASFFTYILISLFEFFLLKGLVYYISEKWLYQTIFYILVLLFINPYIAYRLVNLIPFKVKGLKTHKGIDETFKTSV